MPLKSRYSPKRYTKKGVEMWRARAVFVLNGRDKELVALGRTKKIAEAKLEERIRQSEREDFKPGETATITELFALIMSRKKNVRRLKASSLRRDMRVYKKHVMPFIGNVKIAEVEFYQLEEIQNAPLSRNELETARRVTQILNQIYDDALKRYKHQIARRELVLVHLAEDLEPVPAAKRKDPKLWTPLELRRFLEASERKYLARQTSLYHPYFVTSIAAGLRRGELIGLPRSALRRDDRGGHFLRIDRQIVYDAGKYYDETPKSAAGVRDIPITEDVVKLLERHMLKIDSLKERYPQAFVDNGLMFPNRYGGPAKPGTLRDYFYRILDELGLERVVPHTLRKIYVTYLIEAMVKAGTYNPKDAMRLTGHSDPKVMQTIYTLSTEAARRTTVDPFKSSAQVPQISADDTQNAPKSDAEKVA